ncbi:hypothetical protein PIB30_065798, partial [Stylosanthes scabra]|nr:hypothetical protein [Stylosanthes scabra]
TLRHARQVRRRIEFENNLCSQTKNLASEKNSSYSSDSDFDYDTLSSSNTGTSNMGDLLIETNGRSKYGSGKSAGSISRAE